MKQTKGRKKLYKIYIYNPTKNSTILKYLTKNNIEGLYIKTIQKTEFKSGDILYMHNFKDLGKSLQDVVRNLMFLLKNEVYIITIEDKYNSYQYKNANKVLEGLQEIVKYLYKYQEEKPFGRPFQSKNRYSKLDGLKDDLILLRQDGKSFTECGKKLSIDYKTVVKYCKQLKI